MIKAVIFDYFGVVSSKESWDSVTSKIADDQQLMELYVKLNMGAIHWQDFILQFSDMYGKTSEELQQVFEEEQINPNVLALVKQLKDQNVTTALLTNAHHEYIEPIIEQAQLNELFDKVFISSKLQMIKPSVEIFEHVVNQLDVKPSEAVFIDDNQRNVTGAEAAGLTGILYSELEIIKATLAELLAGSAS